MSLPSGLDKDGNRIYAGITDNLKERVSGHRSDKLGVEELVPLPDTGNLKRWQARSIEQVKIEEIRASGLKRLSCA